MWPLNYLKYCVYEILPRETKMIQKFPCLLGHPDENKNWLIAGLGSEIKRNVSSMSKLGVFYKYGVSIKFDPYNGTVDLPFKEIAFPILYNTL